MMLCPIREGVMSKMGIVIKAELRRGRERLDGERGSDGKVVE